MRTTGNDITIVSSGAGMIGVLDATDQLQKMGMKVEAIDLRRLKPMDTETLVKSVQKTKRLLTFDQSYYTLCPGRRGDCARGGERGRRPVQADRVPGCAAARVARNVQLDAAERQPHRGGRDQVHGLTLLIRPRSEGGVLPSDRAEPKGC